MRSLVRVLASAVSAVVALGLVGCGSSTTESSKSAASTRPTLTVGDVSYLKQLATISGVLKEAPYKVKWASFQSSTPALAALTSGQVDMLYTGETPVLKAIASGSRIKVVGAFQDNGSSVAVVAGKKSPADSVADLKGKTVVVSSAQGTLPDYLLQSSLKSAGISPSDVKIRYMPVSEAWTAFSSGQIDVWSTAGPFPAMALKIGARKVVDGAGGRVSGLNFVSSSERTLGDTAKRKTLTDFLGRLDRALAWSRSHPNEMAEALVAGPITLPLAKLLISQGLQKTAPLNAETIRTIQQTADTMTELGMLPAKVTVSSAVASDVSPTRSATP